MKRSIATGMVAVLVSGLWALPIRADENDSSMGVIQTIHNRVTELKGQLEQEQETRKASEAAVRDLGRQLASEQEASASEIHRLQGELDRQVQRAETLDKERVALKQKVEGLEKEFEAARKESRGLAAEVEKSAEAYETLTKASSVQARKAETERAALDKTIAVLEKKLASTRTDAATAAAKADGRTKQLENETAALKADAAKTAKMKAQELAKSREENTKLESELASTRTTLEAAEKKQAATEKTLKVATAKAQAETKQLRGDIVALTDAAAKQSRVHDEQLKEARNETRKQVTRVKEVQEQAERKTRALNKELEAIQSVLEGIASSFEAQGASEALAAGPAVANNAN